MPNVPAVARSPKRITPEQRDWIYEQKRKGLSGKQISELAARGTGGANAIKAFSVSHTAVNEIYRTIAEQRGELYTTTIEGLSTDGAVDKLTTRLLRLAERELARLETAQRRGKLDPTKVGKLATALERIHKLEESRARSGKAAPKKAKGEPGAPGGPASSFAEQLAQAAQTQSAPVADRVIKPEDAQAVPSAPPPPHQPPAHNPPNDPPQPTLPPEATEPTRTEPEPEAETQHTPCPTDQDTPLPDERENEGW